MATIFQGCRLGWLRYLSDVGQPITKMTDDEVRLLAEIADLQRAARARRKALKQLQAKALAEVTSLGWTDADVARAREFQAIDTGPRRICGYTKGCPLSSFHAGNCCPPGRAAQVHTP